MRSLCRDNTLTVTRYVMYMVSLLSVTSVRCDPVIVVQDLISSTRIEF